VSGIADASVCRFFFRVVVAREGVECAMRRHERNNERDERRTSRTRGWVLLLTMVEAARALSIGRTTMYELVGAGVIEVVRIGRSVRVPVDALQAFVDQQRVSQ
jgi:excisionase family DNA binding protein